METFREELFDYLYQLEERHFWFTGRNWIIWSVISPILKQGYRMLEVGCGNGIVTSFLKSKGIDIAGADLYESGLRYCQKRGLRNLCQLDMMAMPFEDVWDIVGTFDVIEHVDDDILVIRNLCHALKKGGYLVLTVPAYSFLWGNMDIVAMHRRRYTKQEIIAKLQEAGFEVKKASYFMTFLFPLLLLLRLFSKRNTNVRDARDVNEMRIIPGINAIFKFFMKVESLIIRYFNLPFGSSIIVLAQRTENNV